MAIQYNSNYHETMPFSDVSYPVNCTAGAAQTITVAGTATTQYQALFEYASNSNVYVSVNVVPVVPSASATVQPYVEYKPCKRYVKGGDVIHIISPDATTYMGVSLRQIQG